MSYVDHLECSRCARRLRKGEVQGVCACGAPLLVRYDLEAARRAFTPDSLRERPPTLWRYRELLPVEDARDVVSLGEGFTPLVGAARLGAALGLERLLVKDESRNPTGSFKARGLSAAVSMARALGLGKLAIPSAGNAAGALAAYAARAGLEAHIFMPADAPEANLREAEVLGARVERVAGLISDCGRIVRERQDREGWFDLSTLREPYRIEGKKTMGYELAEQLGWKLPDVVLYPTGGGTGLIGMWKAFAEIEALGWVGEARPRLVVVQAAGCAPIVRAFRAGRATAEPWPDARTIAPGLRVPSALGDFLILDALGASRGTAEAVEDGEILDAIRLAGRLEGLFLCPEGAACVAALRRLASSGWVRPDETVVLFNTATGLKNLEVFG